MILMFITPILASPHEQWATIYQDITNNNSELSAARYATNAQQVSMENQFKWTDLELGGYYLTSPTNPNAYTELEFTQSLPSLWSISTQNTLLNQNKRLNAIQTESIELQLFHQATLKLIELVHIHDLIEQETTRVQRANKHLEHYRALAKAGEVSPIAMQKVQLVALEHTLSLQQLAVRRAQVKEDIALLKGSPLKESPTKFPYPIEAIDKDDIWQEYLQSDLGIQKSEQQSELANSLFKLQQQSALPNLQIGGNTQGTQFERYSGVYLGMTIPLYKSSKNIEQAYLHHQQQQVLHQYHVTASENKLTQQCTEYTSLLDQLTQLQSILKVVDYQNHLEQQLLSGAISFSEYNHEYSSYLRAEDQVLDITFQLQMLLAHIYRHRLLESL